MNSVTGQGLRTDALAGLLGIWCETAGKGRSVTTINAKPEHCGVHGVVHGVVLFALADIGMGFTLDRYLGGKRKIATIAMTCNFLSAVKRGRISSHTKLLRCGKSTATLQTKICAGTGKDCALFIGTFHIAGEIT